MWPHPARSRPGVFPWQRGNRFRLLVDGQQFFPRMLRAIAAARHAVDLELYLLEDGQCFQLLCEALTAAARRGVRVRCLFDAFGSRGLSPRSRERLQQNGVALRLFNPHIWPPGRHSLHRDHRKILLVDSRYAWVGGTGATDQFWRVGAALDDWHELMVELRGPVVQDWQCLFDRQWLPEASCSWTPGQSRLPDNVLQQAGAEGMARVAYAESAQHRDILQTLLHRLQQARQRIWLATPYFLPSRRVRLALARAAQSGVDVRLLLTGHETDSPPIRYAGQRFYSQLLRSGVQIHEYQPRFLHFKAVLVDDWCSIGSCNFDRWTLRFNLEANLESVDPQLCGALEQQMLSDFAECRPIRLADWQQRPWPQRARQWLWGRFDRLALYLMRRHP